jgi:hypothetical protein
MIWMDVLGRPDDAGRAIILAELATMEADRPAPRDSWRRLGLVQGCQGTVQTRRKRTWGIRNTPRSKTLPRVVLAGLIAMGGVWFLNHFDPASISIPTAIKASSR